MKNTLRKLLVLTMALVLVMGIIPVSAKTKKTTTPKLDKTFVDVVVKGKVKVTLKNVPDGAKISWTTSDKKVATITTKNNKVTIKGKKAGTAIITATVDGKTYNCGVTVFKKGDKLYEWRKNAVGVRDNYSLIALSTDTNDAYFIDSNDWTHATIDLVQTRKNLLATGLFEIYVYRIANSTSMQIWYKGIELPFGIKPKKPFTYKGVTYETIAECDGYYVDCYTGAVFTEFSEKDLTNEKNNGSNHFDCHFRNKNAKVFVKMDNGSYNFFGYNSSMDGTKHYCVGAANNQNRSRISPYRYWKETVNRSVSASPKNTSSRYGSNYYIWLDRKGNNIIDSNDTKMVKFVSNSYVLMDGYINSDLCDVTDLYTETPSNYPKG